MASKNERFEFRIDESRHRTYQLVVDILESRGREVTLSGWVRETLDDAARRVIAEARRQGELG